MNLKYNNIIQGEIPIDALSSKAPIYDRKWIRKKPSKKKFNLKKGSIFVKTYCLQTKNAPS